MTQLKYHALAELLRTRIRSLPAGSRLPSMRALKQRLGYSLQTVTVALNELEKDGLIVRKHGSGLYVAAKDNVMHVAFCRTDFPAIEKQQIGNGLTAASARRGWILDTYEFRTDRPDMLLDHEIHADAFILMPELVSFQYQISKKLLKKKPPLVILMKDTRELGIDFVMEDDSGGLALILDKLVELRHRKVAFVITEPRSCEIDDRAHKFERLAEERNLAFMLIDCRTVTGHDSADATLKRMSSLLDGVKNELPFSALIFCSPSGCYSGTRTLHDHGWRVPKDCSVVSILDYPVSPFAIPSMAALRWDFERCGEECMKIIEKRLNGDKSEAYGVLVPHTPYWRETLGPAPRRRRK